MSFAKTLAGLFMTFALTLPAFGQMEALGPHVTPSEAKAMAIAAALHVKNVGPDKAFMDFADKKNITWQKSGMYVVVYNRHGVIVAHGQDARRIWKSAIESRDAEGKLIVRDFRAKAFSGGGFIDYITREAGVYKGVRYSGYVMSLLPAFDGFVIVSAALES